MNLDQVKSLVAQGESHSLEFKTSTTQLKGALQTLCGFLNGKTQGTVLIGVTDKGKVIGQHVIDKTTREIAEEIKKIEPATRILVQYIPVDEDKVVISLQTQDAEYAPYAYRRIPYVRNQSTTSEMNQVEYEQLLVERNHLKHAWDEHLAVGYTIEDLDQDEIRKTIESGIYLNRIPASPENDSLEKVLDKLELLQNGHLTNAAVVLFAKKVKPNYPQCHITMARFRGIDKLSGFIDSRIVDGNAFTLLNEASIFIQRHLAVASSFREDSFVRIDHPDLPVLAVREALVNAICHHDYSNRSGYIALAIYEDRLELWSYGLLPKGLKIEDLKKSHISSQRNKVIADIIYKRGLVEKWGMGTLTMIQLCKEHGVPEPEFEEYSGGFSVTFRFKEAVAKVENISPELSKMSIRQRKIYNLLVSEGPLSPKDIMAKLDENIPERTLRLDLATLRDLGFLASSGHTTATVWFVRDSQED